MNKAAVDEIIADYIPKIFGFALTHMANTDKAEELAARITCEVYESLLKAGDVHNVNGYVYRVSRNVYARFIDEERHGRYISLCDVQLPTTHDFTKDIEREETHARLWRKISFMAGIQREILVLHYFERLKQYEIAERLKLPIGTVKWHLHDARKQLKETLTSTRKQEDAIMRRTENLALRPIKFCNIGHSGSVTNNPPERFISRRIAQNIIYATYHEARAITEIAELISTPAAFVEDEVAFLEDNGFLEKLPGGKYLTTVCIHEGRTPEIDNQLHETYMYYAKIVCEKYVPLVLDAIKNFPPCKVYSPKGDVNFLAWSAIMYACGKKLNVYNENTTSVYNSRLNVKRPDGSEYITFVDVENSYDRSKRNFNQQKYNVCGEMYRGDDSIPLYTWQIDTFYDNRTGYWEDNHTEDYVYLYEYICGNMTKDTANIDKYKRLLDKGYLIAEGETEYVNMVVITYSRHDFIALLPAISDELKTVGEELDEKIFNTIKSLYPAHMQNYMRELYANCLSSTDVRTRVLELLYENGTLKPLTDAQKRSVNTIMFCNRLPE